MDEKIIIISLILIFVFFTFNKFNKLKNENFDGKCEIKKNIEEINKISMLNTDCESSPDYDPKKWNKDKCVRASHNCYSYMLNKQKKKLIELCEDGKRVINPQPGHYCGLVKKVVKSSTTCDNLIDRVLCDNPKIYRVESNNTKCRKGFYKGALAVMPGRTYHFYRQDDNCLWSHKDGGRAATDIDASGYKIKDPLFSDRNFGEKRNYSDFCGYFCIPEDKELKNMSRRKDGERWY